MPDFTLDDRLVRLYRRGEGGSQTVRISEAGNPGVWEYQFRLSWGSHITLPQARAQTSVDGLVAAVLANGARREGAGSGVVSRSTALLLAEPGEAWLAAAVPAVDRAIDAFVREFVEYPYLHRVEQSLHVRLFELLVEQPELRGAWPIGASGHVTQLVHKEWPETGPHRGTRGHFDLAILDPGQLRLAHVDHFAGGHLEAGIAIEIGLDAGRNHLPDDRAKLRANGVRAGYLIELQRGRPADDANLAILFAQDPSIRTAYAHVDPRTGIATMKMLSDTALSRFRRAA